MAPHTPGEGATDAIPELLQLGERLARARETAGVTAEDLARRLRIEPRQLQALEEGDHSRLPEGVFVVALARRVAGALQADLEEAILAVKQSRLMRREDPSRDAPLAEAGSSRPRQPPSSAPQDQDQHPGPPGAAMTWRWPLLAALLAACGLAAAWLLSSPRMPGRSTSTPSRPEPAASSSMLPPSARPTAVPNSLRLIAREPSWVEVREVEGRTLFEGTLTGEQRFPLGRGIEVIAGRPHAVSAAIGPAPATPLGGVADIRWKRFSPGNLPPESPSSASPTP